VARARRLEIQQIRNAFIARIAKIAIHWLEEQQLPAAYLERFVEEAEHRLWNRHTKSIGLLDDSKDTLKLELERRKPKWERRPSYGPDLLERLLDWFADWMLIVIPEPELRDNILQELKGYVRDRSGCFSA